MTAPAKQQPPQIPRTDAATVARRLKEASKCKVCGKPTLVMNANMLIAGRRFQEEMVNEQTHCACEHVDGNPARKPGPAYIEYGERLTARSSPKKVVDASPLPIGPALRAIERVDIGPRCACGEPATVIVESTTHYIDRDGNVREFKGDPRYGTALQQMQCETCSRPLVNLLEAHGARVRVGRVAR